MMEQVKVFFAACLYYSGLVKVSCWLRRRSKKRQLIVLNYHRAANGDLRRHLKYLCANYRMLHFEEALHELYAPEPVQTHDRRTPLVLTFDDGYRDNYTHAFTLAKELCVPVTIFLVSGYIESKELFPWLEEEHLVSGAKVRNVPFEGRIYHLAHPKERATLKKVLASRLIHASSIREREKFLQEMRNILGASLPLTPDEELTLPLSWNEVREMEESGWVSFGAHTLHHPMLANLEQPAEIHYEIEQGRTLLEKELGHPVHLFAYPFGQPEEVGSVARQAAKAANYTWVATTVYGINTPQTDPQQLHRIYGDTSRHWILMAAQVSGLLDQLMRIVLQK